MAKRDIRKERSKVDFHGFASSVVETKLIRKDGLRSTFMRGVLKIIAKDLAGQEHEYCSEGAGQNNSNILQGF